VDICNKVCYKNQLFDPYEAWFPLVIKVNPDPYEVNVILNIGLIKIRFLSGGYHHLTIDNSSCAKVTCTS
jgi:hypothetical protein